MKKNIQLLIPLLFSAALAACGGSSSPSNRAAGDDSINPPPAPAPTTGKVTVLLTDAPGHDWDQAIATINSIELLADDRRVLLFEGSSVVDLLSLPDFYEVFSVTDEILPGTFDKVRVMVDSIELVDLPDNEGESEERIMAHLVGGGKIDLNPRDDIVIGPGDALYIEIDFDMNKAFKTTTTGNGRVIVRPVVFVNVTAEPPVARLTRLRGTIEEIDAEGASFTLCQDQLVSEMDEDEADDDHSHCLDIATDEATGIFGADGAPIDFAALMVADAATAIGYLRRDVDDDDDIVLDAVTVELGEDFLRVSGVADGPLLGDLFDLALDPGQNLGTDDEVLSSQVYPSTRIFHKNGDELEQGAIAIGVGVMADGVLVPVEDMPDTLRTALLILDPDLELTEEVLSGEIVAVDFDAGTLQLMVGEVEQCIDALAADIFLISNMDGLATERVGLGDLEPGQTADVFGEGEDEAGCFLASDILAAVPGNTIPVAVAGDDATVAVSDPVMLDGSNSSDDDGDMLSYQWSFLSIPETSTAVLADADMAMASFSPDQAGTYEIELIVNDGTEDSAPDTVVITAE